MHQQKKNIYIDNAPKFRYFSVPKNKASISKSKWEKQTYTIIVGDFNIPGLTMDRSFRQKICNEDSVKISKISKETEGLNYLNANGLEISTEHSTQEQ